MEVEVRRMKEEDRGEGLRRERRKGNREKGGGVIREHPEKKWVEEG